MVMMAGMDEGIGETTVRRAEDEIFGDPPKPGYIRTKEDGPTKEKALKTVQKKKKDQHGCGCPNHGGPDCDGSGGCQSKEGRSDE